MKKESPLISIIIPVYNKEKYLRKCLDSLISQTYRNIEIILVDDGSTDNSGEICDYYSSKDSRITVIHNKNKGASQSRNVGINLSTGDYIMFVDSDDWVDVNICEILINAIRKNNAECAMCNYIREYPDRSLAKKIYNNDIVIEGKNVQRILCGPIKSELKHPENLECFNSMCGKLYPSSAVKKFSVMDLKFIGSSEDLMFNLQVFSSIRNMVYINKPYYHYRKEVNNSITNSYKHNFDLKWEILYDTMLKIINENNLSDECYKALENRIALGTLGLGLNCINEKSNIFKKTCQIKKITSNDRRRRCLKKLEVKYMPLHWRIFYICAKYNLAVLMYFILIAINYLRRKF